MKLDEVLSRLLPGLKRPLPGKIGQLPMAPLPLDEERFGVHEREDVKKGAVLLLLYPGVEGCMMPFIKRTTYKGVHSGQVSLPGGKWEQGDQDLWFTAVRETEEEIGVNRDRIHVVGSLSKLYIPPSNYSVQPFLGYLEEEPVFYPDPREVERVITCSFDDLVSDDIRKSKELDVSSGSVISAPYFDIDNEAVWGATAMILSELMYIWEHGESLE